MVKKKLPSSAPGWMAAPLPRFQFQGKTQPSKSTPGTRSFLAEAVPCSPELGILLLADLQEVGAQPGRTDGPLHLFVASWGGVSETRALETRCPLPLQPPPGPQVSWQGRGGPGACQCLLAIGMCPLTPAPLPGARGRLLFRRPCPSASCLRVASKAWLSSPGGGPSPLLKSPEALWWPRTFILDWEDQLVLGKGCW